MKSEEEEPALPVEVIMEILGRLPLKPLARARLVCKQWRSLIQEHHFMETHMARRPHFSYWYNQTRAHTQPPREGARVSYLHGCDGLLLIRNKASNLHLVWNPASRLVLELPAPRDGSYGFALCFVPATKSYKVASFFKDKDSKNLGCELLTLGCGHSMEWRRLEFPGSVNQSGKALVVPAGGAAHCVAAFNKNGAYVVSLDVETELLTVNLLPGGVYGDVGCAKAIDCDGKLGFAVVDKQEMRVMVLRDYKNKRWCGDKGVIIIPLPFLKDEGFEGKSVVPLLIREGEVWFYLKDKKIFVYTVGTRKMSDVKKCERLSSARKLYSYKPSLVSFEGMRADDELKAYRPRNIDPIR